MVNINFDLTKRFREAKESQKKHAEKLASMKRDAEQCVCKDVLMWRLMWFSEQQEDGLMRWWINE